MNPSTDPKLDSPGAGLPFPELFVGRILFKLRLLTGNSDSFRKKFVEHRLAIRALIEPCDEITGETRILIPRLRGMEDSSRFWSVWMTLDHLRIVNSGITGIVTALQQGIVPPGVTSTADVKPDPNAGGNIVAAYEETCDRWLALLDRNQPVTAARYTHPWFGPLDSRGWEALMALHLGIHRAQIEEILRGVRSSTK
jgi:hypothetical protein